MKKLLRVYQIDSFTKNKFSGNPAGVVTNADGLTPQQMQRIARELNNSETAFIFSSSDEEYDVHVRFFTPKSEVPICGHATIAAHYARAIEMQLGNTTVLQKTGAGILPVDIIHTDSDYRIVMTQGEIVIDKPLPIEYQYELLSALGIQQNDLRSDCPIAIASTGHSKVMIGINDLKILHNLTPSFDKLSKLSGLINCNGYYVFTLHPDEQPLVHGRMFAPAVGVAEDPVTGNANGPLGAYLIHYGVIQATGSEFSFEIVQGEAIDRAGKMLVSVELTAGKPSKVKITGDAVIAFKTEIEIEIEL